MRGVVLEIAPAYSCLSGRAEYVSVENMDIMESTKYLTAYRNTTAQYYIGQNKGNKYGSHATFAKNGYVTSITGDAISEVWVQSGLAWNNNSSHFVMITSPYLLRGRQYVLCWQRRFVHFGVL